MTLYEIDAKIAEAIENIFANADEETGEVSPEDMEALNLLQMDRNNKLDNIACYIKSEEADAKAIDEEIKALQHRKKVKQNKADRLREFLQFALGGEKFESSRNKVTYRKSAQVSITNEDAIPMEFLRVKYEPNKTAIKDSIKAGEIVPGAIVIEKESMILK